jgi:hypothetical protein
MAWRIAPVAQLFGVELNDPAPAFIEMLALMCTDELYHPVGARRLDAAGSASVEHEDGARGRSRTDTLLTAADFESAEA